MQQNEFTRSSIIQGNQQRQSLNIGNASSRLSTNNQQLKTSLHQNQQQNSHTKIAQHSTPSNQKFNAHPLQSKQIIQVLEKSRQSHVSNNLNNNQQSHNLNSNTSTNLINSSVVGGKASISTNNITFTSHTKIAMNSTISKSSNNFQNQQSVQSSFHQKLAQNPNFLAAQKSLNSSQNANSGVNSNTLVQKLQSLQKQQSRISQNESNRVGDINHIQRSNLQTPQASTKNLKSSNIFSNNYQNPHSSAEKPVLYSHSKLLNQHKKQVLKYSNIEQQTSLLQQSPIKREAIEDNLLITGFQNIQNSNSKYQDNQVSQQLYSNESGQLTPKTLTPTTLMTKQQSLICSSGYKHQNSQQQLQKEQHLKDQQKTYNFQTEINTQQDESFMSKTSSKSIKTVQMRQDIPANHKRQSALGTQSNYYLKDNLTDREHHQDLTITSQKNFNNYLEIPPGRSSTKNGNGDTCSTNSARQRVRVKINPKNGKNSLESSTSETPNQAQKQEIMNRANTAIYNKFLIQQQASKNLAVSQVLGLSISSQSSQKQLAQSINISKTPSTKLMHNNGDENGLQSQEITQDQTYTSLLMQNPSTKNLLRKITEKHKELEINSKTSNKPEPQQQPSSTSLQKQLALPKKQQPKPIKIDLGDTPDSVDQQNQDKPTTLTSIGNKTIVLPSKSSIQTQQPQPHMNLERDFSNADEDDLRLSNMPSRQPSDKQLLSVLMGSIQASNNANGKNRNYNGLSQFGNRSSNNEVFSQGSIDMIVGNFGINAQQTQLHKYGDRTQNLSRKNLAHSESKKRINIEIEDDQKYFYGPGLNFQDLENENQNQRYDSQDKYDQSIAKIQIEKVNEEYCLQSASINHSKKNTLFCQSAIVTNITTKHSTYHQQISVESPYQITSTTPNAQQAKKKPLVKRFKYKNLTENQTPSSKSFLTENRGSMDTPQSNDTSVCGISQKGDTQQMQNTGNSVTNNYAYQGGQLHAPTFIHQDSGGSTEAGGRLLRNSQHSPIIATQHNYYYKHSPNTQKNLHENTSTGSQQDIQHRITEVKQKLLTKTQIFKVDENRRISLPLRNTKRPQQIQDHYGDSKSGIASADISESGSIMQDYPKLNSNLNSKFEECFTAPVKTEILVQNTGNNFTGFMPSTINGGGTFSAQPQNQSITQENKPFQKQQSRSNMHLNEKEDRDLINHSRKQSDVKNAPFERGQQEIRDDDEEEEDSENNVDHNLVIEQEELLAASLPTIKGTLYKKIDNPKKVKNGKSYKKRYGLVRNKKFKYYKDKEMRELGGIFDFDRIQCVIMIDDGSMSNFQSINGNDEENDSPNGDKNGSSSSRYIEPKKFRIEVIGSKRNFLFHVQSSSALRQWTQALYANWHASKSFTLVNQSKLLSNPFWKSDVISLPDFRKLADTGDILLFTGSSFVTRVQRAITMSEYDHVAMLLRYSNGKLVMFESTGQTGVAVLDWDLFVKNNWNKLYTKLCFRKLRHNRTLETMQKLETFIRSVIGMKYKLNTTKIFRKKYENDAENLTESDDKSYFCSELVASAYKCLGLLPKEISGSQYWPGNFSNKSGLKLLGDSMLEDEQTILFEE